MKQQKFSPEERELLSKSYPITRKWLKTKLETQTLYNVLKKRWQYLNSVERNIRIKWHENCLAEMKRLKLHISNETLFKFIADPKVSVTNALAKARKSYPVEENKERQKDIGKMISILQRLADSEKQLYLEATEIIFKEKKTNNVLETIALRIETTDESSSEYTLFTEQCIKHYNRLLKLKITPNIHELKLALNAQLAGNIEIFTSQVNIVCSTYKKGHDVPMEVKDTCFEFIKESISHAGYFHANLINYVFRNDEISERAFQLFIDSEKVIRKNGMQSLPNMYANRLARKKGLHDKPIDKLTEGEKRILKVEHMFV